MTFNKVGYYVMALAFWIIAMILARKSMYGRWLYAVGINVKAARVSGIPTDRVIFVP